MVVHQRVKPFLKRMTFPAVANMQTYYLDVAAIARTLSRTRRAIYNYIADGTLKADKIGDMYLVRPGDFESFRVRYERGEFDGRRNDR
jgi:hypothetical protein